MDRKLVDWIWRIRGALPIASDLSDADAYDRLDPLLLQPGTSCERASGALVFRKKDQAAQDKMAVFDAGTLRIERTAAGSVLRYELTSRALLFCFLAPLLFLGFAQLTKVMAKFDSHPAKIKKKPEVLQPFNPVDKFFGAPAPEKPKGNATSEEDAGDDEGGGKKPSPKPAYIFAGIFATLYVIGRILEARVVDTLFRRCLEGSNGRSLPAVVDNTSMTASGWFARSRWSRSEHAILERRRLDRPDWQLGRLAAWPFRRSGSPAASQSAAEQTSHPDRLSQPGQAGAYPAQAETWRKPD